MYWYSYYRKSEIDYSVGNLRLQISILCYIIKSVQGIMGLDMIRNYYYSNFESLVRCGIIFCGADNESIPIINPLTPNIP